MALADLQNEVYAITNRPDLVGETLIAIRQATIKAHFADQWSRDLVEVTVSPLTSTSTYDSRYVLDITAAPFVRFRQLAYARETPNSNAASYSWDNSNSSPYNVNQFRLIESDSIFDEYNRMRSNTVYMAGNALHIRTNFPVASVDIGYYSNPSLQPDPGVFSSWLADDYSYIIVQEAAATIFKMIGKDEEHQRFAMLWEQAVATLRTNLLP